MWGHLLCKRGVVTRGAAPGGTESRWFGVVISGIGMFPSVLHRAGKPLKSRAQQNPFNLFPLHRPLIHIPTLILFSQCVLEVWACFRAYRTSFLNTGFFVLLRAGTGRAQPAVPLTDALCRTRKAGYWVFLGSGSCTHVLLYVEHGCTAPMT